MRTTTTRIPRHPSASLPMPLLLTENVRGCPSETRREVYRMPRAGRTRRRLVLGRGHQGEDAGRQQGLQLGGPGTFPGEAGDGGLLHGDRGPRPAEDEAAEERAEMGLVAH